MTAYSPRHAFGVARDLPELRPERRPSIFRRLIAAWRRRPAAPEVSPVPSGVAEAAFPCCIHCITEQRNECDPAGIHPKPCSDGCNAPPPAHDLLSTTELAALNPGTHLGPGRPTRLQRPDGEVLIDERHKVTVRRLVYGEASQLDVERDMAIAAGQRARERYEPASPELLRQVLTGLEAL